MILAPFLYCRRCLRFNLLLLYFAHLFVVLLTAKHPWFCGVQLEEEVRNANQRIVHLLHKDDAVDKPEYERVAAALTAAQDKLTSLQADVNRLQPLADQAESCKARVESLEVNFQLLSSF